MPISHERHARYAIRRLSRLEALPWLRFTTVGGARAWYVAGQLLAFDEERRPVERYLSRARAGRSAGGDEEIAGGLRRYHVPGLDVPTAVREITAEMPAGARVAGLNHAFLACPFNHGGPFGPPVPVAAGPVPVPATTGGRVPVTIIDTGLWSDTTLPVGFLSGNGVEYEQATDVDNNGMLDGDVGHANFIGGVIAGYAPRSSLRVLKVLDTFGVCTEDQLVQSFDRLDASTKVINVSMGGFTPDSEPPIGVRVALENALSGHDRVVVAAAGNDGNTTNPFWPAAFAGEGHPWSDQVVAVAAHDGTNLCDWSNMGPWVTLAAPGSDIRSTFINHTAFFPDGWAMWSGTSFAAPRVAAEIATRVTDQTGAVAALDHVKNVEASQKFGGVRGLA